MLPKPINAVLPEECLDVARRVLAPSSCLSDDAKYAYKVSSSLMCLFNANLDLLFNIIFPRVLEKTLFPLQVAARATLFSSGTWKHWTGAAARLA